VLGALDAQGHVDVTTCSRLVSACQGLPVTFHRAFDMAADPDKAVEAFWGLGCRRLLTSGQEATAVQGKDLIRRLVDAHGQCVTVMPGGGITEANLEDLLVSTGASEFHASARVSVQSRMEFRNSRCAMGGVGQDDFLMQVTSVDRVANMVAIYKRLRSK
jgi:copper homeostasis protein